MIAENPTWSRQSGYEDLETLAHVLGDEIASALNGHLATGGELIDTEFELQHPDLIEYTTFLVQALEYEPTAEARATSYRAAHCAYLICEQFVDHPVINPSEYFTTKGSGSGSERIMHDTQMYLQHRPALDSLLGRYMPELDPSMHFATLAETVGALVFLQIEMGEKRKYNDRVVDGFSMTLEAWNGNLDLLQSSPLGS